MNMIVQLDKITRDDTIKLLANFYEIEDVCESDKRYIEDMVYTPAEIVEMCCSSKNIGEFILIKSISKNIIKYFINRKKNKKLRKFNI